MPSRPSLARPWWEPCRFEIGEVRRWRIGPITVHAERHAREWRVWHQGGDDPLDDTLEVAAPESRNEASTRGEATAMRYAFAQAPPRVALEPRLADRPMIVRPAEGVVVAANESTQLYVSTPLWASVTTLDPRHALREMPCYRPSDTWFGPDTVDGELCYASRTTGRTDLEALPMRPHRAVTPIRIEESAGVPLPVERLKVPVDLLPLYATDRGLWTPRVTLVRGASGDVADVRIDKEPPRMAGNARRIAEPRRRSEGLLTLRTFSQLLAWRSS
ncbi:MAG: hypothetical protein U5K81_03015 [Trueperaceae bacterium]|nr:hypothetical protein [Trueperaceae bacterium]